MTSALNPAAPSLPRTLTLKELIKTDTECQLRVRELRNDPAIRQVMYSDHEIDLNEHLAWLHRLKQDPRQIVFCVLNEDNAPIGVVSVNNLDQRHRKADWAFYLSEQERGGLGAALEFALINFVFSELSLDKLNCEVIEGNDAVVKLHKKFGFEVEGFRRSNVAQNGERRGVHFLGLTRADWLAHQPGLETAYGAILQKFNLQIEWQPRQDALSSIDQIEAARAKNNLNWMGMLRLALEKSPHEAQQLVGEIRKLDEEITTLTHELLAS